MRYPKDSSPLVSIIIPVYNGSNFLSEAIDSALAQTYKNIEILVINDGSNDNGATEKIAKSYGNKIKYYKKENGGVATALNYGISKMTGEYFSWLSHDDMYRPRKIESQINCLKQFQSDNIIVASNVYTLFPNGIKKKEYIDSRTFDYIDIFLATSANVGLNGCSLLIPKSALINSGGFDKNLPVTQDYDLWFRLKDKYKFVLLNKHLVISRRHEMQDSIQKRMLMLKSGDKLHYGLLGSISYKRFEKYFIDNKVNIEHTRDNYYLYKSRGYLKTASTILKNILKYFYENDIDKFYKFYLSEVISNIDISKKISKKDYWIIDKEYTELINSGDIIPIKISENSDNKDIDMRMYNRYIRSIKQDGFYLTGEKIIRKFYKKFFSKG